MENNGYSNYVCCIPASCVMNKYCLNQLMSNSLAPFPSMTAHSIILLPFKFSASRKRIDDPITLRAEPSA